jgi:uncharacterized protein (DUF2126 family)
VIAGASIEDVQHAVNKLHVMSYVERTEYLDGRTEYRITKLGKKKHMKIYLEYHSVIK